jgi:alkylresorcinol/alkylpyrone synthase
MRTLSQPVITGMAHALPGDGISQEDLWENFYEKHFQDAAEAGRIFANSGITTRHMLIDPRIEGDIPNWGTARRMERYIADAVPLGKEAVAKALKSAGLRPQDVGLLAVASCTGYATPGLDLKIAGQLGMSNTVERLLIGHMGCYAAIPGLGAVSDFTASRGRPAVLLCLELCSLHIQPPTGDLRQVVAHALFGDAAAAVVVEPGTAGGYAVVDMAAATDHRTAGQMTWEITDYGFRLSLSPKVPTSLAESVGTVVRDQLLAPHGLHVEDIAGWAVHPGGRAILEVVAERLALPAGALQASYDVLDEYGNCSSSTVLMVLQRLQQTSGPTVAMAFGPGLTLYASLLHRH